MKLSWLRIPLPVEIIFVNKHELSQDTKDQHNNLRDMYVPGMNDPFVLGRPLKVWSAGLAAAIKLSNCSWSRSSPLPVAINK
jgi:hypothetical protein